MTGVFFLCCFHADAIFLHFYCAKSATPHSVPFKSYGTTALRVRCLLESCACCLFYAIFRATQSAGPHWNE